MKETIKLRIKDNILASWTNKIKYSKKHINVRALIFESCPYLPMCTVDGSLKTGSIGLGDDDLSHVYLKYRKTISWAVVDNLQFSEYFYRNCSCTTPNKNLNLHLHYKREGI